MTSVMSYSQMAVDSQEHAATTRLLASVNKISSTHVYKILHNITSYLIIATMHTLKIEDNVRYSTLPLP